ncbi:FAD-binding protein [Mycolicibacterium pulveris]|uniref:FAD-binding protein n=1 Tax=Mycolicibacterium pulveris TaxID=36813 RepID=UPI003CF3CE5C
MNWDEEVDLVCTGSGTAGLASAISVADVGGDVFIAGSAVDVEAGAAAQRISPWLGLGIADAETNDYFAAVSSDLAPLPRAARDLDVPIRVVSEPARAQSGRTVAPFVGARLGDWAARCLASPYGYLHSRVSDWHSCTVQTAGGDMIAVAEIGTMTPASGDVGGSVHDWLLAQARDRCIAVHADTVLQRIVFEEGAVVGAVFTTPQGPLAVRARHGVTIAAGGARLSSAGSGRMPVGDSALRVCLVSKHASRFGRVELLTSESLGQPVPPTCRPANRRLRDNLHTTHDHSPQWRCGKVHGHPPVSQ